ncbi:MAG: class I SAM-dependent methyltransferase [Burkholderiales bacterium]|nr:class I SAM-dependent methyltransferase [Burkholderiales bacterium]
MNTTIAHPSVTPDYATIKSRQQATWASGDFAVIGPTLDIVGEMLAEAVDVRAGERVLDVAAGNGNATLAAAHRLAEVTSTDYVPALLERGRARVAAEGLTSTVAFEVADVEALPFAEASFDVVLSTYGAMFAPDHQTTAREMLRVVRPGGRIGLANWTPDGFVGELLRLVGRYVPPPAGVSSPLLWGTEAHLDALFGRAAATIRSERRNFVFRYRSAAHFVQVFRDFYGPTHKAFATLDSGKAAELERDLVALLDARDHGGGGSLVVPGEYLEVVVTTRDDA